MESRDGGVTTAGVRGARVVLARGSSSWLSEWAQTWGERIAAGHSGRGEVVRVDALPWEQGEAGLVWQRVLARCGRPAHAEVPVGTTVVIANAGAADPESLRRLLSWAHADARSSLALTLPDNGMPLPDWADTAATERVDEPGVCFEELVEAASVAGSVTPRIQARRALRRSGGVGRYARALVADAQSGPSGHSGPDDVPPLVVREVAAALQGRPESLCDAVGIAAVLPEAPLHDVLTSLAFLNRASAEVPESSEPAGEAPVRQAPAREAADAPVADDSHITDTATLEQIEEAARTGLVRLDLAEAGPWRLRIAPVVAEAMLQWAGFARVQRWHRAAARVSGPDTHLLHEAAVVVGTDESLSDELQSTARRLEADGALRAAAAHLAAAARLVGDEERAGVLRTKAANAVVGSGDLVSAADYLPAIRVLPVSPAREAVLGYNALSLGDSELAEHHLVGAWRSTNPRLDPAMAGTISARMVLHQLGEWDGPRMEVWAERALAVAEPGSAPWWEAASMSGLAQAVAGRTGEADQTCQRLVAEADSPLVLARAQLGLGWVKLLQGDLTGARVTLQSCADLSAAGGSLRVRIWALGWHAYAEFLLGHWDRVMALTSLADRLVEEAGLHLLRPLVAWPAVSVLAHRGETDRARAVLEAATVEARSYTVQIIPAAMAAAELASAEGRYEETAAQLSPLLDLPRGRDSRLWLWQHHLARALVRLGRDAEAERILFSVAEQGGDDPLSSAMTVSLRAQLLARSGDIEGAVGHFDRSVAMADRAGALLIRTRILHARGETLRRAGQRSRAAAALTEARQGFVQLGAVLAVEKCDADLRLLGPREGGGTAVRVASTSAEAAGAASTAAGVPTAATVATTSVPDALRDLTEREREVTALVASGMTNKEVGAQLFCSVKTVQYHLTRVYAKLGVRSRSELAALVATLPTPRDPVDTAPPAE